MANGPTTTNSPGYLGELFQTGKRPNTFLKMLGGIQGGIERTESKEFSIGVYYNLRTSSQPAVLEGAAAPTAQNRPFTQSTNTIQIFHEAVETTWLAQSDNTIAGIVPIPQGPANGTVQNPRSEEAQVAMAIGTVAQDVNFSCLQGVYANPADATATALKTRGIMTAIVTNYLDKSGVTAGDITANVYRSYIEDVLALIVEQSGFETDGSFTLFAGTRQYRNAKKAYYGLTTPPYDRNIAGLNLLALYTDLGVINLALDPDMPADQFGIFNMAMCGLVGLEVPNKGYLFETALPTVGSADRTQIYGQFGCDHGPEFLHGKVKLPAGVVIP